MQRRRQRPSLAEPGWAFEIDVESANVAEEIGFCDARSGARANMSMIAAPGTSAPLKLLSEYLQGGVDKGAWNAALVS
jgi:hypothetical protein